MAKEALGMVETRGLTAAIEAADAMTKAAEDVYKRQLMQIIFTERFPA